MERQDKIVLTEQGKKIIIDYMGYTKDKKSRYILDKKTGYYKLI